MQQQKMIVLALIGSGLRYGLEMEDFARRTSMRNWAKIGMSTIYKALGDLEREGAINVEVEESDKGPPRKSFKLTDDGRARMVALIGQAVTSDKSIYSERIAGLVFAPLMSSEQAQLAITASIHSLNRADAILADSSKDESMDEIGLAVVDYYRSVYAAERRAMRRVFAVVCQRPLNSPLPTESA